MPERIKPEASKESLSHSPAEMAEQIYNVWDKSDRESTAERVDKIKFVLQNLKRENVNNKQFVIEALQILNEKIEIALIDLVVVHDEKGKKEIMDDIDTAGLGDNKWRGPEEKLLILVDKELAKLEGHSQRSDMSTSERAREQIKKDERLDAILEDVRRGISRNINIMINKYEDSSIVKELSNEVENKLEEWVQSSKHHKEDVKFYRGALMKEDKRLAELIENTQYENKKKLMESLQLLIRKALSSID
jgi:hypothetical protein